ncbi:MAG: PorP/SprF family type IX secretion system membrane protein [Bacteroidota bacterium]
MKHVIVLIIGILFLGSSVYSQDPQFSHFYAIPLQMGPAFAGSTGGTRVAINARDQWTAINQEYMTFSVMADHYFFGTRSGAGIVLYRDQAGAGKLATSIANLQYAYSVNITEEIALRAGLQMGLSHRAIDYSRLVFGDQLRFEDNVSVTSENSLYDSKTYLDFGTSFMGVISNFWVGATFDHIVQPNQSLMGHKSVVPMKLSLYSGGRFTYRTSQKRGRKMESIYLMLHYNEQLNFKQALLGAYWETNLSILGMWYRGIPFVKAYESYMNTDALIFMLGFRKGMFTFLYSYDFTLSKLVANTAGSHEITLTWNWHNTNAEKKARKRMNMVPCPMSDSPKTKYYKQKSF